MKSFPASLLALNLVVKTETNANPNEDEGGREEEREGGWEGREKARTWNSFLRVHSVKAKLKALSTGDQIAWKNKNKAIIVGRFAKPKEEHKSALSKEEEKRKKARKRCTCETKNIWKVWECAQCPSSWARMESSSEACTCKKEGRKEGREE